MSQLPSHADATRRYPTFDQEGIAEIARVKPVSGTQYVPLVPETVVVMIDPRVLMRECLAKALEQSGGGLRVLTFSTLEDWNKASKGSDTPALVIIRAAGKMKQNDSSSEHGGLARLAASLPTVLLSDAEDAEQILTALECGIRGYIPTSVTIDVAVKAIHLVRAGGTYIPATSLMSWRKASTEPLPLADGQIGGFTSRQATVLRALRQGKANKRIAYELNMREGTVKVHVRNIMKKLKARNRTEVAYKTNEIFGLEHD
jgi:DNA-binding NarL/FixJ family response regulator